MSITIQELDKILLYLNELKLKGGLTYKNIVKIQKLECTTYNIQKLQNLYLELKEQYG